MKLIILMLSILSIKVESSVPYRRQAQNVRNEKVGPTIAYDDDNLPSTLASMYANYRNSPSYKESYNNEVKYYQPTEVYGRNHPSILKHVSIDYIEGNPTHKEYSKKKDRYKGTKQENGHGYSSTLTSYKDSRKPKQKYRKIDTAMYKASAVYRNCKKTSPSYTPNHPDCAMPKKCDSTSLLYMPNHPDCEEFYKCNAVHFKKDHPDCILKCKDPCNQSCPNFNPDLRILCPDDELNADDMPPIDGEEPVDMKPADMEPVDKQPVYMEPVDMEPADMEPVDMQPVYMEPVDMEPVDMEPVDMEPVDDMESVDDMEPVDDMELVVMEPVDMEPVDEMEPEDPCITNPDDPSCITDQCDENHPEFDINNPACIIDPPVDPCIANPDDPSCITDTCDENHPEFDINNPSCIVDPPVDPCISNPDDASCITDECDENHPDFDINNPACIVPVVPATDIIVPVVPKDPVPPVVTPQCNIMLTGTNANNCQIVEEYQAITCGECLSVNKDITEMSEACKKPSADLLKCEAKIGTADKDKQSCKTYWFQFTRSTMSPKCAKPKTEYSAYVTKPAPIYRKPKYQKQMHDYGKIKYNRYSNRKYYYVPKKLYTPRKMTTILYKRY